MKNTFDMLKNARSAIIHKMQEYENLISGGFMRIIEACIADDFSDFSEKEKEALVVWQAYRDALLTLQKADEELAQAVEIETKSNLACK